MTTPVLSTTALTKRYPGVVALDDVTIEIRPREVIGLVGENGAGKSTLLKILAGVTAPDSGAITLRGRDVTFHGVAEARRAGIGMVFQDQSLVPSISVAENILLGSEGEGLRRGIYSWKRLRALARRQLEKLGSGIDPAAPTETLSFAERQMVELAKALSIEEATHHAPIILLDEPTSVLDASEISTLFSQIERLRESTSIVFVSHRLDEVLRVADRVYVMRNGQVVAERARAEAQAGDLYRLMVGHDVRDGQFHDDLHVPPDDARVRVDVRNLARRGSFSDISFQIHAGEVLGLAGVQGSGREAVCRALFGAEPIDSGVILVDERPLQLLSPADAVRAGIGYVPAERRSEGVLAGMSVAENMTIAHVSTIRRGPFLDLRREAGLARQWMDRLRIKADSPAALIQTLSGGTQQKVVLARWMIGPAARLMIMDHPTRGLDVGAKSEVYAIIRELAASGLAIALMADTLEETIALSDRVMVMKDGHAVATVAAPLGAKPSLVDIVELMV